MACLNAKNTFIFQFFWGSKGKDFLYVGVTKVLGVTDPMRLFLAKKFPERISIDKIILWG